MKRNSQFPAMKASTVLPLIRYARACSAYDHMRVEAIYKQTSVVAWYAIVAYEGSISQIPWLI